MSKITLNLLVIRSSDIDRAVEFYKALGLTFEKHNHTGTAHYASESAGLVFEIYPLGDGAQPTSSTRLGFAVSSVELAIEPLVNLGARIVSPPKSSPWGTRAVVSDFDGHKVELTA